jgi:hypothetical protein
VDYPEITDRSVVGYLVKYATKSTEAVGGLVPDLVPIVDRWQQIGRPTHGCSQRRMAVRSVIELG